MKRLRKQIGVYLLVLTMLITSVMPVYAAEPVASTAATAVVPSPKLDMVSLINYYIEKFDVEGYKRKNPDLVPVFGEDASMYIMHYVLCGISEGRRTGTWDPIAFVCNNAEYIWNSVLTKGYCEFFDLADYKMRYPNLVEVLGNDNAAITMHYLVHGVKEGRTTKAPFDPVKYAYEFPNSVLKTNCKPEDYAQSYRTLNETKKSVSNVSNSSSSGGSSSSGSSSGGSSGGTVTQVDTVTSFQFTVLDGNMIRMSKPITSPIVVTNVLSATFEEVWLDNFVDYTVYIDAYATDKYVGCIRVDVDDFVTDAENWLATFTVTPSMFSKQLKFAEGLDATVEISYSPETVQEESIIVDTLQLRYEYADNTNYTDTIDREVYNMSNESDLDFAEAWVEFFDEGTAVYIDAYSEGELIDCQEITVEDFVVDESLRKATLYLANDFFKEGIILSDSLYDRFILDYASEVIKSTIDTISIVLENSDGVIVYPTTAEIVLPNTDGLDFTGVWDSEFGEYIVGVGALSRGIVKDAYTISEEDFTVNAEEYKATLTVDTTKFTKEGLVFADDLLETIVIDFTPSESEPDEPGEPDTPVVPEEPDTPDVPGEITPDYGVDLEATSEVTEVPDGMEIYDFYQMSFGGLNIELPCTYQTLMDSNVVLKDNLYYDTDGSEGAEGGNTPLTVDTILTGGQYFPNLDSVLDGADLYVGVANDSTEDKLLKDCTVYSLKVSKDNIGTMSYAGITQDSTLGDVSAKFGAPYSKYDASSYHERVYKFPIGIDTDSIFATATDITVTFTFDDEYVISDIEFTTPIIINTDVAEESDEPSDTEVKYTENFDDTYTLVVGDTEVALPTTYAALTSIGFTPVSTSSLPAITADTEIAVGDNAYCYFMHEDFTATGFLVITEYNTTDTAVTVSDLRIDQIRTVAIEGGEADTETIEYRGVAVGDTVAEARAVLGVENSISDLTSEEGYAVLCYQYYKSKESNDNVCVKFYYHIEGEDIFAIELYADIAEESEEPLERVLIVEDTELSINMSLQDLINAGWIVEESTYSQHDIKAGKTAWEFLTVSNTSGAEVQIMPYNETDSDIAVEDSTVVGINVVDDWHYAGISGESTVEELTAALGVAGSVEEVDGGVSYIYNYEDYSVEFYTVDESVKSIALMCDGIESMISDSWPELNKTVTVNGIDCTLDTLLNTAMDNNWELLVEGSLDEELAAGEDVSVIYTFVDDSEQISVTFKNDSMETKLVKDCVVIGVTVSISDSVISGVTVGSTKDEALEVFDGKYCVNFGDTGAETNIIFMDKDISVSVNVKDDVVASITMVKTTLF